MYLTATGQELIMLHNLLNFQLSFPFLSHKNWFEITRVFID